MQKFQVWLKLYSMELFVGGHKYSHFFYRMEKNNNKLGSGFLGVFAQVVKEHINP